MLRFSDTADRSAAAGAAAVAHGLASAPDVWFSVSHDASGWQTICAGADATNVNINNTAAAARNCRVHCWSWETRRY